MLQNAIKSSLRTSNNSFFVIHRPGIHSSCYNSARTTFYDDLEIEPNASTKQIKDAYIRLSKMYHPDVRPDDAEAAEKFHKINQAFETLSNGNLRRKYDRGQLGKTHSVADREMAKHRFEGDQFVDVRNHTIFFISDR